jgi:hypothetical protein
MSGHENFRNRKQKAVITIITLMIFILFVVETAAVMGIPVESFAAETESSEERQEELETSELSEEQTEEQQTETIETESNEEEINSTETESNEEEKDTIEEKTKEKTIEEQNTNEEDSDIQEPDTEEHQTEEQSTEEKTIEVSRDNENKKIETDAMEISVLIYNYDIVNVVVPTSYAVALNPYELPIRVNETTVSTNQVVARNYGIINKSTLDKIVTVTLVVEDQNDGKITFVDSKEAVMNADKDTYAVYFTAVPADDSGIKTGSGNVDVNKDTTAAELADVYMTGAENNAVVLKEGENQIAFKLSKAVYQYENGQEINLDTAQDKDVRNQMELTSLATDGTGAAAFTFDGMMNQQADWSKITNGIKVSVVYSYETAAGDEKIADGTSTVLYRNGNEN